MSRLHFWNSQLWQSGFSRVYSNSCCSYSFEPEIIKIGQSSHKMYSNNILNFQESTTILNACTKKSGNLLNAPCTYIIFFFFLNLQRSKTFRQLTLIGHSQTQILELKRSQSYQNIFTIKAEKKNNKKKNHTSKPLSISWRWPLSLKHVEHKIWNKNLHAKFRFICRPIHFKLFTFFLLEQDRDI